MIPKSMPSDLIRGWEPVFGKDHAQMQIEKIMNRRNTPRVSFIGFGEAGQAIAAGLREGGIERIAAWDILFPEAAGARLKAAGETIGVRLANSAADAVARAENVVLWGLAGPPLGA